MEKKEFIRKMEALEQKKKALEEQYKASMPVKPNQVVMIDGQTYWLERYRIVAYSIVPTFYEYKNGKIKKQYGQAYPKNWQIMKPVEA